MKKGPTLSKDDKTKIFIYRAIQIHGNKYLYEGITYLDAKTKLRIVCKEHGEFYQSPDAHLRGSGCPTCAKHTRDASKRKTTEQFILDCVVKHGPIYNYKEVEYTGAHNKISIICYQHGRFEQIAGTHLSGSGCPKCGNIKIGATKKSNAEEFIQKAKEVHHNTYDYSGVVYVRNSYPVKIICKLHGEFTQSPANHLCGKGCPTCGSLLTGAQLRKSSDTFIQQAKEIHGDRYDYSSSNYVAAKYNVTIRCREHGEFSQRASHHLSGHGCPYCSKTRPDTLYLITDLRHYKIGVTSNLSQRLHQLESSMSCQLIIVSTVTLGSDICMKAEKELHKKFIKNPYKDCDFDGYTEWRELTENEVDWIITTYNMKRI